VNLNTFDTGTSVKLIFGDKVVKYGGSVRAAEAYNMEYVRKRTRINIPAVLLAFSPRWTHLHRYGLRPWAHFAR